MEVNRQLLAPHEATAWHTLLSQDCPLVRMDSDEDGAKNYWYDHVSGLWGWVGGPIEGMRFLSSLWIILTF